jgi:surface antigen
MHSVRARLRLAAGAVVLLGALATAVGLTHAAQATTGMNDYPYANAGVDQVDRWNFYTRECTSFVAWRINNDAGVPFTNQYGGVQWGNAAHWRDAALATGVPVDGTPTVGSVAVFPPYNQGAGGMGHVAWVIGVSGGTIQVEDYNDADAYNGYRPYLYSQRSFSTAGVSFLHFGNRGTPPPGTPETWGNPASGKYLDLYHSQTADGTKLQIWPYNGTNAQWWMRAPDGGGYVKLVNRGSGKCIDVKGPSRDNGAAVHEWTCYPTDSQLWRFEPKGRTYLGWPVYQLRNKFSGRCLDIYQNRTDTGTPIIQWDCHGGPNQEWF